MLNKKRGQAWGFDVMIAAMLFLTGIITFYLYTLNSQTEGQNTLDGLIYDGNFLADSLMSEGFPQDWNETNVITLGITNQNKINETKLERFYTMSHPVNNPAGYEKARKIIGTQYNYFVNLSQSITFSGVPIPEEGIGFSFTGQQYDNLIKINRVTIYNNKPTTLHVYIWK